MVDLSSLIPLAISIGGAIGGAAYARKRGLPNIKEEVDKAKAELIETLRAQLAVTNEELGILRPSLGKAQERIRDLESEVERLERRVTKLYIRIDELERTTEPPAKRSRATRTRTNDQSPS